MEALTGPAGKPVQPSGHERMMLELGLGLEPQ